VPVELTLSAASFEAELTTRVVEAARTLAGMASTTESPPISHRSGTSRGQAPAVSVCEIISLTHVVARLR